MNSNFTIDDLKLIYEKVGGDNFNLWLTKPLPGFEMQTPQQLINSDINNIESLIINLSYLLPK